MFVISNAILLYARIDASPTCEDLSASITLHELLTRFVIFR
jgi:hypothetical protein